MSNLEKQSRKNRPAARARLALAALVIASLACSLPRLFGSQATPTATQPPPTATAAPPTPTPQPLPPALVESDPQPGAELPLNRPITLYFNQPMERASVEAAFSGRPAGKGRIIWQNDATLVFDPGGALPPESELSIEVGTGARSAGGMALLQPVSLKYRTAGYLRLVQTLPEPGAMEIDPTSAVVAAFNRPVVPLGAEPASLPAAFFLEPAAEGRGEWLNTSTYIFYPEPGLEGGREYAVRLNQDLHSTDSSPLQEAKDWTFRTVSPRLVSLTPLLDAWRVRLDTTVTMTFNQPMDTGSVEAAFSLLDPSSTVVPGNFSWNEEQTVTTFRPNDLLERNLTYQVVLRQSASGRGGTPLASQYLSGFTTVDELAVIDSNPREGGQAPQYASVTLSFSSLISARGIQQSLTVSPTVSNLNTYWDETALMLSIYGDFQPAQNYQLTLAAGVRDLWGSPLAQPFVLHFSTAPYTPQLYTTLGTDVLFVTPEDTSLSAQAVNVNRVGVTQGSVPLQDFFRMLAPDGYEARNSYQPADGRFWQQDLDLPPNRSQRVNVNLTPDRGSLSPGLYYMRLNPESSENPNAPMFVASSNTQLTFKLSATDALVWAVDLRTRTPIAGAPVTIYAERGVELATGATDDQGIFHSEIDPLPDPYATYFALLGQPGEEYFGISLSSWNQGIATWDFGVSLDTSAPRLAAYFYTDRPIYRPGQTVYFRAIARQAYNSRYTIPDQDSLALTLYGPMGEELDHYTVPLSAYGTGHGQIPLPENLAPGDYRLANVGGEYESSISFKVADYRKPEINLQVSFNAEQTLKGQPLAANVDARYFFDAPAGNVPITWTLYAASTYFELPGYRVGVESTSWLDAFSYPMFVDSLGYQIAQGISETDPQGKLALELPAPESENVPEGRAHYTLEVTAVDESGLPVSARTTTNANPDEFYIGVRADTWIGSAGEEAGFEIQTVDWNTALAGPFDLRAEFQKVTWVQSNEPGGPYDLPKYVAEYTPVGSTDFRTDEQGKARVAFVPQDPGTYQLRVTGGQGALTETIYWVGGAGQAVWPNLPNQRLQLTADRQEYQPGDNARVFIPNPFSTPAQALVSIERSLVLRYELVDLQPGGNTIDIPLSADDAPNVYASVTLLGQNDQGQPDFRQGLVNLPVAPVEQTLTVSLEGQPERAGPGDEVSFDVRVTDFKGEPVQGEFSLAVVDLAALALADPNSADIVPAFYGNQSIGVRTSLALVAYANRRAVAPPGRGGGGGGEAIPTVVRENFPDTAFWNAEIVTDADGRAHVTATLPDSLTTWQVDVRGLTADTRVGEALSRVVTSKELLVRPVTPRFLVVEDHVQLAAVVQNNTTGDLAVEVGLQANGIGLDDPAAASQQVTVAAGGRQRVEWWGTVQDVETVDLVFSAASGSFQDLTRPPRGALPVLHNTAPQTFATSGVLDEADDRLELVSLPRSFDPRGGSLKVTLAPSLASAMLSSFDVLEHFPYECTEQTLSRFLPNLETYRALQDLGVDAPALKTRLDRTLSEGLQLLLTRQNLDGGWGWWPGENSDAYITAYVIFGLSQARQAGEAISENTLQRAVDYLRATQFAPGMTDEGWMLDRLAFEHFALAQAGAGDLAGADALYEVRDQLSPWGKAVLALTLENLSQGSEKARTLVSDLESGAIRSATGAHWETALDSAAARQNMSTPVSTSAIVLYALAQRNPGSPLVADAVRYLVTNRFADGAWESTFSTAWALMALTEVMKGTGELGGEFAFTATLNGAPLAAGQAEGAAGGLAVPVTANVPLSSLYPDDPNALRVQRDPGAGRLYYTAALNASRPVDAIAPLQQGISVSRAYYPFGAACPQNQCDSIQSAQPGQLVKARLTLTLENDAYYLMVEDYLPAGAEILDTSLKTSQQGVVEDPSVQPAPQYDSRKPYANGWGWWLFSAPQIYDDHIAWAVNHLPAGTYELTYTLVILQPGEYRVLPAHAWEFYFPEVQGTSAGALFTIEP